MPVPPVERSPVALRLTRSAADALAASGATLAPDPALIHAQAGDLIQPDGGGTPLRVLRRTWRTGPGGAVLELLLDWPAR